MTLELVTASHVTLFLYRKARYPPVPISIGFQPPIPLSLFPLFAFLPVLPVKLPDIIVSYAFVTEALAP